MLAWFSSQFFMGSAQRKLCEGGWPAFMYHKIGRPTKGILDPFLFVTPERFAEQLAVLRQSGFGAGSLSEMSAANGDSPPKAVITFDDGCQTVFTNGLEILV